ncbi:acetate kinase [soil metagenome]
MIAFVVNSGSSSIKWTLVDVESGQSRRSGLLERVTDHAEAMRGVLDELGDEHPDVVGHRVVHGGSVFTAATLVTDEVEAKIDELSALAPLHNPPNLAGIRAARAAFPGVPNVAVFDTAFHQSLAPEAYTYAIDAAVAREHGIRRYGFHGTSYQYVSRIAGELLGRDDARLVVFHLGNGASVAAINAGRSVETSMGMTPLEGLVMGTRSGDLDAGILFHLGRSGFELDELDTLLNRRSGLLGLAGSADMRDVQQKDDAASRLALDVYHHRLRHYLGAYLALLGGADAIVFTAGVGENSPTTRAAVVAGMEWLGIELDERLNAARLSEARVVSSGDSRIAVLVVPTNEELEIARQSVALLG